MTQPPSVQRTPAGLAFLDDARKRRKQRRRPPKPPKSLEPQAPDAELEDSSAYALDLAVDLLDSESEPHTGNADEVLAQHEAASESPIAGTAPDERRGESPPDEILEALEAHHQRAEPHQRHSAPRGSADLDAYQAQRPRAKPAKPGRPRRTLKRPQASGWLVAAGGLAAVLVAIAITVGGGGPATTSAAADHPAVIGTNVGAATLAAGNFPAHGQLLAVHHQPAVNTHTRKHGHRTSRPPQRSAPSHHTAAAAARPSPSVTGASSAASNTPATAASSSSTPAASDSQSGGSTSSPQPAGPAGTGGTVGGNCDPKCS